MSVAMFTGTLLGTLLALAVQDRHIRVFKYLFGQHPALAKLIGAVVAVALVLIPALALSGEIALATPQFFWGGCFAFGLVFGFTLSVLTIHPHPHSHSRRKVRTH